MFLEDGPCPSDLVPAGMRQAGPHTAGMLALVDTGRRAMRSAMKPDSSRVPDEGLGGDEL